MTMTQDQIIRLAESLNAKEFLSLLEDRDADYEVLDMDNIGNPNEGFLNLVVEGMPEGQSILFSDGKFTGE
jgi:hypothetical protein